MRNFDAIEGLLHYNFQEMRALGHRASDEALIHLHVVFKSFFDQFKDVPPSVHELQVYVNLLAQIVARINQFEYAYYINKYQAENPDMTTENIEKMAHGCQIKSHLNIPIRLQFWAAGESFGDTIRFPSEHRATIKNLVKWNEYLEKDNITPQI